MSIGYVRSAGRSGCLAAGLWCVAVLTTTSAVKAESVSSLLREADRLLLPWHGEGTYDAGDRKRLIEYTESALGKVREAEKLAPADARVKHRLGVCLSLLGRYTEAETAFAEAEEQASADFMPTVLQERGLCAMRQRQYDRALEYFQRVLAIRPWQPDTHYHMGLIYEKRGLLERARDLYAEELNHHNLNGKAWQAHSRLNAQLQGIGIGADDPRGRSMHNVVLLLGVWVAVLLLGGGLYLWLRRLRGPTAEGEPATLGEGPPAAGRGDGHGTRQS